MYDKAYDIPTRREIEMCKTKLLSVRVETSLYDKIAKSPVGVSEFVRQSVIQRLDGKKPRGKSNPTKKADERVIQRYKDQISQMQIFHDHLNNEIMYLRELHQNTMSRVLQLPENTGYNRDPIADMQQGQREAIKDQRQANIITKLGNVITDYKNNR